jgi:hypothetical protein
MDAHVPSANRAKAPSNCWRFSSGIESEFLHLPEFIDSDRLESLVP